MSERIPIQFGPEDGPLFGVYEAPERVSAETAVVLCYPILHEYIPSHRAFALLARRLCDQGWPVLRFDYSGCGDSWGTPDDARVSRWAVDVGCAIETARQRSGADRVSLVGLRFGATLAMLAASDREDVEGIALWEPVVDGKRFLAELDEFQAAFLKSSYVTPSPHVGTPTGTEVAGFPLTKELRFDIARLSLLDRLPAPDTDLLILDATGGQRYLDLANALQAAGATVRVEGDNGRPVWRSEPDHGLIPAESLARLTGWMGDRRRRATPARQP